VLPLEVRVTAGSALSQVTVTVKQGQSQNQYSLWDLREEIRPDEPPDYRFSRDMAVFYGENSLTVTAEDVAGNIGGASLTFTVIRPELSAYYLLILAPECFRDALEPLIDHKNATAMPAKLLTLEEIRRDAAYESGRDEQERVKLAIAAAHRRWGIRYVLLMGDVDQFPVRYTRTWDSVAWGHGYSPSDLYYADLYDGAGDFDDWDGNRNGLFGEMNGGDPENWSELNQDAVDLRPDVCVGRIPASTPAEVSTVVNKIIRYEQGASSSWAERALFVTGEWSNPNPTADYIADLIAPLGYASVKHYWTTDWRAMPRTEAGWFSRRAAVLNEEINRGVGFVVYIGHGRGGSGGRAGGNGGSWTGWYDYRSIAGLNNAGKLPIVFAAACDTAMFHYPHHPYRRRDGGEYRPSPGVPNNQRDAPEPAAIQSSYYDLDCMAEHFMVKHDVGGIAYLGGYTGLQSPSKAFVKRLFEELVARNGSATLGDIWAGGVSRYIEKDFPNIERHWGNWFGAALYHHIQKMMLFGDPSLRIGGCTAGTDGGYR
jgi:hypothetical protein